MIIALKEVILNYILWKQFRCRLSAKFLDYEKYKNFAWNYPSGINMFGNNDQHKQQGEHLTPSADAVPPPSTPAAFPPPMSSIWSPLALIPTQPAPASFPSLLSYGSDQCPWLVSCPQVALNPPLPPYTPLAHPQLPTSPLNLPLQMSSSCNPSLPWSPPPPSYPPPAQPPPPPPPSPRAIAPSPSSLPQPALHMLKSADASSPLTKDSRFVHLPVHGSLPLPPLPILPPGLNITTSTELASGNNSFFVDKMPSKVYIEVDKPRRLRQALLHNRYVSSPPQQKSKVLSPARNLIPTKTFGPIRSHFKSKTSTPELITLSDDEGDDICVLEEEINPLPTDEGRRSNECITQNSICNLVSPIPVDNIRLPDPQSVITPARTSSILSHPIPDVDVIPPPTSSLPSTSNQQPNTSCIGLVTTKKTHVVSSFCTTALHSAKQTPCTINGVLIDRKTGKEIVEIGCDTEDDDDVNSKEAPDHIDSKISMEVEITPCNNKNVATSEPAEVPRDIIKGLDEIDMEYLPLSSIRLSDVINQSIYISDETFELRQSLQQLRNWESTGFALHNTVNDPNDAIFTLMSYNVLSQQLLLDNQYLYNNCKFEHLEWQYRWTLLQYEITEMNPDILTLQEVQSNHYHEFYLPWLTHLGYQGVYKKRTGPKKSDGCAVFFRKDKFMLLESISVEYCQPRTFLDRDNVGLVCSLQSAENGAKICVATTHLLFNPRRHEIRLAQAQMLLAEVERLSYIGVDQYTGQPEYCPVIVTGDMNAVPQSTLMYFFKNGSLDYNGRMTNRPLPPLLGLTNTCQHKGVLQLRSLLQERARTPGVRPVTREEQRHLEEARLGLFHSERRKNQQQQQQQQYFDGGSYRELQHPFSLRSVFKHTLERLGGAPEVTTMASQHHTVDYILYSLAFSTHHGRPVEGPLKLLARYGLLSDPEVRQFGSAPSAVLPSDHLPLAAKFLLKRNRANQSQRNHC